MIRKGVAAIVFRKEKGRKKYLLLKRKLIWKGWEWLKGGCKPREKEETCLVREIKEEINVKKFLAERTKHFNKFKYHRKLTKDHKKWSGAKHQVYLVEVFSKKVKFDKKEHSGAKWFSRKDALKMITWDDQREIFKKLTKS